MFDLYSYITGWICSLHPVLQNTTIQILLLLAGTALTCAACFLGYRLFFGFIALLGFLSGFCLGFYLCSRFTPELWIRLATGAIAGLVMLFLARKIYSLGIFLTIGLPSILVACSVLAVVLPTQSGMVHTLGGIIIGVLIGLLAVFLQYPIIVISSGFYGAFLFSRTFLRLIQFENQYVFYGMVFVFTVAGICYQFTHTRR